MKKSKIIIPAAAILALSVGASVTGTVAWFTASRTTSFGVNNLAVINTAGDLGVTLKKGIGTEVANGATSSVTLSYLKDASYDAIGDNVYVATLNNDGSKINGTRAVLKDLSQKVSITTKEGATSYQSVYVINEWSATFTTSSVSVNYLYFNPSSSVSKINEEMDTNSVFKSVRVAMRNTAGDDEHTVIWAPYTSDGTVYYVNNAGNLAEPQDSDVAPDASKYVTDNPSTSLVGKYTQVGEKNLVATSKDSLVSEGISSGDALKSKALLSKKLQGAGEGITATSPEIHFTLWFEGLDPNCISATAIKEVSTKTAQVVKSMSLGFYAVDSTTFTA